MSMNSYVGWGITALLSMWLGKGSDSSSSDTSSTPEKLSVTETSIGTPVPVVLGRAMIKSPLVIYWGDFRADRYTETYSAHAEFSAWPLVLSLIATYIAAAITGHQATPGTVTAKGGNSAGPVNSTGQSSGATVKDDLTGPLLNALFIWLLSWLINGRNLKTTIQKGFKYYLGYQMIICMAGTNSSIKSIYLDKIQVWSETGNNIATAPPGLSSNETIPAVGSNQFAPTINGSLFSVPINNENLFGGPDEGGGFVGTLNIYLGGDSQGPDPWMTSQMSASTIDESVRGHSPAYRDYVTMVVPTAYIGKQATIPETWIEYEQIPNRLGLGAIGADVNPAEAIYEILVNTEWGLCQNPETIDSDSLIAIGTQLANEKIGVTVKIDSKNKAREILDKICNHVNAVRYIEPSTGRLRFKLIRGDYSASDILLLNDSNCTSVEYTRMTWQEASGEVCVVYTSRNGLYEETSLYKNDPAVIDINDGDKDTKSSDYKYFTTLDNALWAAQREGRQNGYPLASVTIVGNRTISGARIGDVVRLDWPPYGISNMILRITDVDLGDFVAGDVTLECCEDIFSLDKTDFGYSDSTGWQTTPTYPTGVQYFDYIELPWEISHSPDGYVYAIAAKPSSETEMWTVLRKRSSVDTWAATNSTTQWTSIGRLVYDYAERTDVEDVVGIEIVNLSGLEDTQVRMTASDATDLTSARKGTKLIAIGSEIMGWGSLVQMPNGHWKVSNILRGVFDTIPAYHAAGENVYFLESGMFINVTTGAAVTPAGYATTEEYNIITSTATNTETPDATKARTVTTTRRQERPNPPGRIRMADNFVTNETRYIDEPIGDVTISWSARNKQLACGCVSQDDTQDYWAGYTFQPPTGLEYVLKVYAGSTLVDTIITANTSHVYKWADRCNYSADLTLPLTVEIGDRVNRLECAQFHTRTMQWKTPFALNGVESEEEALSYLNLWGSYSNITILANSYIGLTTINYTDFPVFIAGTKYDSQVADSIICYDGSWLVPNGTLYHVVDNTEIKTITMDAGYILNSGLSAAGNGGNTVYKWDGSKLVII